MDVYVPEGAPPAAGWPAVLVIHGGGWRSLDRRTMAAAAERFAEAGYVAVNVDYRLVPAGQYPVAVEDCLCALSYTRAHAAEYGIDPGRIATMGYSAGGHLASMLGVAAAAPDVQPDCASGPTGPAAAVISGAGPQDLWLYPEHDVITEYQAVIDFVGGDKDEVPGSWDAASPITHVTAGAPPYLFVHGEEDWFASLAHSERMRDRLVAVGSEAQLLSIPGGGHLINRDAAAGRYDLVVTSTDTPESWLAMVDFLDRTIGGAR
jgi:acetyl esterase/lipase